MAAFLPIGTVLLVGGGAWRVAFSVGIAALVVVTVLAAAARYGDAISRAVCSAARTRRCSSRSSPSCCSRLEQLRP
jgi:hypothetical protein